MSSSRTTCKHEIIRFECSSHARDVGFKSRTPLQRLAATLPSNKPPTKADRQRSGLSEDIYPASTFPGPLVLPDDELSWDPEYEPQSLKTWTDEPERNDITESRRTVYLVSPPAGAAYVTEWTVPNTSHKRQTTSPGTKSEDVLDYLKAFYHGLPVKVLSKPQLKFVKWPDKQASRSAHIGLNTGAEVIAIRTRPSKDGYFSGQLNLDDLLDAAIAILPKDAYALLMLTDHDLYEDDEDDFCCGRAYGGSRVAVVSTARYNPALDRDQHVETDHAWPASHCQAYLDMCCGMSTKMKQPSRQTPSVMRSALVKFSSLKPPESERELSLLWLSRVCKTASHELGHCFGLDHCVFYACIMQGTAGLTEDARQPPYLCPVDLAKVLHATGADSVQRYRALLAFCERFEDEDRMFGSFAAWLRGRIVEIECRRQVVVLD